METWIAIAISVISAIVTIAVGWGVLTAKLEEVKKEVADMKDTVRGVPTKEHCILKHSYIDKSIDEVKEELKEIKCMIQELINVKRS